MVTFACQQQTFISNLYFKITLEVMKPTRKETGYYWIVVLFAFSRLVHENCTEIGKEFVFVNIKLHSIIWRCILVRICYALKQFFTFFSKFLPHFSTVRNVPPLHWFHRSIPKSFSSPLLSRHYRFGVFTQFGVGKFQGFQ